MHRLAREDLIYTEPGNGGNSVIGGLADAGNKVDSTPLSITVRPLADIFPLKAARRLAIAKMDVQVR